MKFCSKQLRQLINFQRNDFSFIHPSFLPRFTPSTGGQTCHRRQEKEHRSLCFQIPDPWAVLGSARGPGTPEGQQAHRSETWQSRSPRLQHHRLLTQTLILTAELGLLMSTSQHSALFNTVQCPRKACARLLRPFLCSQKKSHFFYNALTLNQKVSDSETARFRQDMRHITQLCCFGPAYLEDLCTNSCTPKENTVCRSVQIAKPECPPPHQLISIQP